MRPQKLNWLPKVLFTILFFSSMTAPLAHAENDESFRTPAKRYGSAYSLKMTVHREGFEYDVAVWVKPDQKISSLDKDQMAELGWTYPNLKVEDAAFSGEVIEAPHFGNVKSEWAYVPEFPKSCCYGIIGQDILKGYEVRFDPNPPTHLEWTKVIHHASGSPVPAAKLSALFSLRSSNGTFGKQKIDLARTPYRLNLAAGVLEFEKTPDLPSYALKGPLFHYHFIPPARDIFIDSLPPALAVKAKKLGFKSGLTLNKINHLAIATLSRFEVDDFLTGKRTKTLELIGSKIGVVYDFEKNEFTSIEPIQSNPSRH